VQKNNKINMVINIISYTFLNIIFYYFMWDFKTFQTFQVFMFSIFSFAISLFISDKFKLSNNKFIKILQKFVFISIILALIGLILYLFEDFIFNTIFCESDSESADENNRVPLITMVNGLCYLNYIEFSLFLSLLSLFLRKILYRKLKNFISQGFLPLICINLKNKYIKNKEVESKNDENVSLNKAFNIVDKYTNYIIVFIFICLFWVLFINIYFSNHLADNIHSFVKVYNHINNNSLF